MAIGLLFDDPGVTQEQYYQTFNEVTNNGAEKIPGMLSHHAGPSEQGFCVIETWESQEALQQFFETRLGRALQTAGIQSRPTVFQIINTV